VLSEPRAWTKLTSNHISLPFEDGRERIRSLLLPDRADPNPTLLVLLHEAAHHWTFLSAVGSTLAALELRARRAVYSYSQSNPLSRVLDPRAVDDLVCFEVATELLRPLGEGLALFAEFDSVPGGSSVISRPIEWVERLFPDRSVQDLSTRIRRTLLKVRAMEASRWRRENVLAQPLHCSEGGYLPGYLMTKKSWHSLWLRSLDQSRLFDDSDFFLTYMRSFFFDDLGFVSLLLDPATDRYTALERLSTYLNDRIVLFFRHDAESLVREFERRVSTPTANFWPPMNLSTDPVLFDFGRDRLEQTTREMVQQIAQGPENAGLFADLHAGVLAHRALLELIRVPARVKVTSQGHVEADVDGRPLYADMSVEGATEGEGLGSIEVLLSGIDGTRVCAVHLESRLVSWRTAPHVADANAQRLLFGDLYNRDVREHEADRWMRLRHRLDGTEEIAAARAELPTVVDRIYLNKALLFVPDERLDEVVQAMAQSGFLGLLGETDLVRGLALLGLFVTFGLPIDKAANLFSSQGLDLDATLNAATRLHDSIGVPAFAVDGYYRCFV
jgi:hypothetical protein